MTDRPFSALSRHLPLAAALALYLALTIAGAWQIWQALGEPIYAIDDAHIHMAMARNLAQHGVYGVTPWQATHASSAPLWVLLLAAAFAVAGPAYLVPGLIAALASLATLAIADRYLRAQAGSDRFGALAGRGFVLCLIVLGASLPPLTWQGMEHPLHAALFLLAAWLGARAVAHATPERRAELALVLLCFALPVLRYESLWLTVLLCAGLLWRRRFGLAAAIALASAASVCAIGFWALSQGLTFLPAPILTKSVGPMLLSDNSLVRIGAKLLWHPLWRLGQIPLLAMLFLGGAAYLGTMLWRHRRAALAQTPVVMVALFVAGTWVHASFATFGWGNRYEAYLIVLGLAALGAAALQLPSRLDATRPAHRLAGLLAGLAAALTIYTALGRAQATYGNARAASAEVLDRDFYLARFLAAAYPRDSVMAMNIGAVVWAGEPHLLDPVALGTPEILPLIFQRRYDLPGLQAMARQRQVRVFATFDDWFAQWFAAPPPWIEVARLEAASDRRRLALSLYAPDAAEAQILAERLRRVRPAGNFSVKLKLLPPFE
ncbi:MAG: hypothetical protein AB7R90_12260 [Reyranellaceae bacterium]